MSSAFLTVDEFAIEFGVSASTVNRMIKRGDLKKSQVKKHHAVRIHRDELERLKTGAQPDGCAPVGRGGVGADDDTTNNQDALPGPKPRWLR